MAKEFDDIKEVIKNTKTLKKYSWYHKRNINLKKSSLILVMKDWKKRWVI